MVGERGVVGRTEEGHEPGDDDDSDGNDGDDHHERLTINTSIDRDPVLYGQHPDKIPPRLHVCQYRKRLMGRALS